MSKKESVSNRQYTEEFKVEAVRLGESIGATGRQAFGYSGVQVFGIGSTSTAHKGDR